AQPRRHALAHVGRVESEAARCLPPRRVARRVLHRRLRTQNRALCGGAAGHLVETQRELAAAPRRVAHGRAAASHSRQSPSVLCSVRSTCSGVTDTWPFDVAWKSVPGPASRASPAGPIQYIVSPRGLVWRISGSLAWRRPRRVTTLGSESASGRFGMFTLSSHGARSGGWRSTCSITLRATRA